MRITQNEITDFFKEYILGFMNHDIDTANNQGANFLVALGLSDYTEVLGGLVTGDMKERRKAARNYRAFLPYMGQHYVFLDKKINLYDRVRCGLAHEYFIKGEAMIARTLVDSTGKADVVPGILYVEKDNQATIQTDTGPMKIPKDTVVFGTRNYARDFSKACEKYYADLTAEFKLNPDKQKLLPAFEKSM